MLYKHFMDGEKSGKKMSPEEVHLLLRRELSSNEYVKPQQIRSLFSRWSKLLRAGKLTPPSEENDPIEEEVGTNEDDDIEQYNLDLLDLAKEVSTEWQKSDWVALVYDGKWYPGVIVEVNFELAFYHMNHRCVDLSKVFKSYFLY